MGTRACELACCSPIVRAPPPGAGRRVWRRSPIRAGRRCRGHALACTGADESSVPRHGSVRMKVEVTYDSLAYMVPVGAVVNVVNPGGPLRDDSETEDEME